MNDTSATPRTDLLARDMGGNCQVVDANFARKLERELATANARLAFMIENASQIFMLPTGWRCAWTCDFGDEHQVSSHCTAFDAIDAAIAKNAQINDDIKE